MTVSRSVEQSGPAIFNVYFRRDNSDPERTNSEDTEPSETPASSEGFFVNAPFKTTEKGDGLVKYVINKRTPGTATGEEVTTINMKHRNEEEILAEFMEVTGAVQVQPTPGELETMRELEEQAERSKIDYQKNNEVKAAIKREQDMLKQAREMMA
jgi:large subunit ribosomal protein MRP49